MTLPFSILLEMESEERMHMDMNVSIPMMGEESMTMFIRDGYVYTDEGGHQMRTAMDTSDDVDMTEFIELFEDLFGNDFDWEDFTASASAESTNNGYRLAFTYEIEDLIRLVAEVMSDMPGADIEDLIDEMTDDLGEGEWDIAMVMYLDEDYMLVSVEYTIAAEVSIEEMGETMEMTLDLTLSLTVGDVSIDFPAWLDEMSDAAPVEVEDTDVEETDTDVEETEIDVEETDIDVEETDTDTDGDTPSAASEDWRDFLAEYEDVVNRLNADPTDLTLLTDMLDLLDKAEAVTQNVPLEDLAEFMEELTRIAQMIEQ